MKELEQVRLHLQAGAGGSGEGKGVAEALILVKAPDLARFKTRPYMAHRVCGTHHSVRTRPCPNVTCRRLFFR